MKRLFWPLIALLLAGCAATGPGPGDGKTGAGTADDGPLDTEDSVRHEVDNRAVAMLWDKAESARRSGRTGEAVAALERALRLAPEDPVLWSRLAEMRLRQRDFAVAENLAAKSNALAGDRRLLRYRNWLLIAEARSRRGDEAGAREARRKAEELRGGQANASGAEADPHSAASGGDRVSRAAPDTGGARAESAAFEVDAASAEPAPARASVDPSSIEVPPGFQLITPDGSGGRAARESEPKSRPEREPEPADDVATRNGSWSVQAAAFRERASAFELRERLRARGYPAFIRTVTVDDRLFHRVRVGPVGGRDAARALARDIAERVGHEGMVVRDDGTGVDTTAAAQ